MRLGLVRNPVSGRGRGASSWPTLQRRLLEQFQSMVAVETTTPHDAPALAAKLAAEGCDVVAAMGGDGTVCGVLEGLIGTPAALAVIPSGTGNDLARTLGFGSNIDLAIQALTADHRIRMDVLRWQQGNHTGYCANAAGCGFDAAVAARINRGIRFLRGNAAYLAAIVAELGRYRPIRVKLIVDDRSMEREVMLCAIANAQSYGGGLKVAPKASLTDGKLDVVLVGAMGSAEFLLNFPKVLNGTHLAHRKVEWLQARKVELTSEPASPVLVDGELLEPAPTTFEVLPGAIEVIAPERAGYGVILS